MKTPEHNDHFPRAEYEARLANLRAAMRRVHLDALLLATEENIVYATGFLNGYWVCRRHDDTQLALIPADDAAEPMLLIPGHLAEVARTSVVDAVRTWGQHDVSGEGGAVGTVVGALRDRKLGNGRIGVERGPDVPLGMPLPFLQALQARLPGVAWVDGSGVMEAVQRVKSPLEVEKMRIAGRITCEAFEAGLRALRVGMSEKELGQVIVAEMAARSPDVATNRPWTLFVHATGRGAAAFDGIPSSYRFAPGDFVYIDGGFIYHGYHTDMIRCGSVGAPPADILRNYSAIRRANMDTIAFMKPGVSCRSCYDFFAGRAQALGYGAQIEERHRHGRKMLGHSLGLRIHETPFLDGVTEEILVPGMVFAVEGKFFYRTTGGPILKNEENIVITEEGTEWLTPLSNDLWVAAA